ncbi:MAG TPA: LysR family transcriptional regulator, partial [Clostridia bacterium]|nr:LysR family transcriptional regulator [Clostridia bacterium]
MELKQLQAFIAIAEEGSITAAARRLHIAQPPLSQQLKQLEQELGVQLIQRGARHCTLTEAGKHLFGRAQELLSLAAETKQSVGEMAGDDRMPLRIGMISSSGGLLFSQGLRRFVKE